MNYWDELMADDEHASEYMLTYGEGPGSPLRHFIGHLINADETILDVGCGPGWNLDHFLVHGPKFADYAGLDYSERFVRIANERNNGFYRLGDVRDFQEPDKSWDVVLMQDVLEHTNGYEKPLQEALRVARKRVIITFWHLSDDDNPHINDDGKDGWGAWYDKRAWEKYLDDLKLNWLHDEIPRKDDKHDIYVIDLETE